MNKETKDTRFELPPLVETNISDTKIKEIKDRISLVKEKAEYYRGIDAYTMAEVKELAENTEELLAEYQRLYAELEEALHENIILKVGGQAHALGE